VELVAITPPVVTIRLTGACDGCGSSQITLEQGVKKTLREHCLWIEDIQLEQKQKPADDVQTIQIISPFEAVSHRE
jgi:Fe-S cluster biogenesis protein NfuA